MARIHQELHNKRLTGQTSTTTTAVPITKVGATSSGNTTFTATTVVDASAWDLSAIVEGDVAVTSDGYRGIITAINDGTNTLTIADGWLSPGAKQGRAGSDVIPTDTSTVTIHRIAQCASLMVKMLTANGDVVRVGLNGAAVVTDFPIAAGANILLFNAQRQKHLDVTQVYVRADSGTQIAVWCVIGI